MTYPTALTKAKKEKPSHTVPSPDASEHSGEQGTNSAFSSSSEVSQAAMLKPLQMAQQQAILQRIGKVQGNRHVQRVVAASQLQRGTQNTTQTIPNLAIQGQSKGDCIRDQLYKALDNGDGEAVIMAIIVKATDAEKHEVLNDHELIARMINELDCNHMLDILLSLNASSKQCLYVAMDASEVDSQTILTLTAQTTNKEKLAILHDDALKDFLVNALSPEELRQALSHLNASYNDKLRIALRDENIEVQSIFNLLSGATENDKKALLDDAELLKTLKGRLSQNTMMQITYYLNDRPEIELTEQAIGEHIIAGVNDSNQGQSATTGIWFPVRYQEMASDDDEYRAIWKEDYLSGYANPAYFEQMGYMDWRLKPGVSASEGLRAWLDGLTIAECFTTLMAIQCDAVRAVVGNSKFDDLYGSAMEETPEHRRLRIKKGYGMPSVNHIMKKTDAANKGDVGTIGKRPNIKKGEWYYFCNHPKYPLKHPGGSYQGENAVYLGEDQTTGEQLWLGFGISSSTEEQLYAEMFEDYNAARTPRDYQVLLSSYLKDKPDVEQALKDHDEGVYESLYIKYRTSIPDAYREDKGVFKDKLTDTKEIAEANAYTHKNKERKGGFSPGNGKVLNMNTLKKLKGD